MQFTIPEISTRRERIYFVFSVTDPQKNTFEPQRYPKYCLAINDANFLDVHCALLKFIHIFSSVNKGELFSQIKIFTS